MTVRYTRELLETGGREVLAEAVAASTNWTDLMRRLDLEPSGGRRRALQKKVAGFGLDTSHFKKRSPWRKYTDEAIAAAAATSSSLREVVNKLGATPASGTLSHISRRIAAAGIDVSHFPGMGRPQLGHLFTLEELRTAAASAESMRGVARELGVRDDSQSRAAVAGMLHRDGIDTSHFRNARLAIPEDALRAAVPKATSYADVMRALGLEVNDTNHRRIGARWPNSSWTPAISGVAPGPQARPARVSRSRSHRQRLWSCRKGHHVQTEQGCTAHCKKSASRTGAIPAAIRASGRGGRSRSRSTT